MTKPRTGEEQTDTRKQRRKSLSQLLAKPLRIPTCNGELEIGAVEHDGKMLVRVEFPRSLAEREAEQPLTKAEETP